MRKPLDSVVAALVSITPTVAAAALDELTS